MLRDYSLDYISVGGNRHPSSADWSSGHVEILVFGARNNVVIWDPLNSSGRGVIALLPGHTDLVNVVRIFCAKQAKSTVILSGSVDKTIRVWLCEVIGTPAFHCAAVVHAHNSSINTIAVLPEAGLFASGAADGTVKIWKLTASPTVEVALIQQVEVVPKFFPLSVALSYLESNDGPKILAVGGTRNVVQIYVAEALSFKLCATLTGHEGWIRSLAFTRESNENPSDIILASASQDKYIRLWRVHQGLSLPAASRAAGDPGLGIMGRSLSNKAHCFEAASKTYSITFEALLLGHEDWIYTVQWRRWNDRLQLLSASADNSLAVWEADSSSGIWLSTARLGEISAQKGSTTATGSAGGFWIGLWSPKGDAVVSLGRTGSWRLWRRDGSGHNWMQQAGVSGHTKEVKSIAWSRNSGYLLSTGLDQTTRLHAQMCRTGESTKTWHEFSRPQIHGYDLNTIDTISDTQFISGADEKLLRVFNEPTAVADLLEHLCGIRKAADAQGLADAANIPVLGLSNKAIEALDDEAVPINGDRKSTDFVDPASIVYKSTLKMNHPPYEDHLARHTLWPETEKLYGHGYEISCCAASFDGMLVATACRASSIDHAVIRLYETRNWRQIDLPLKAHSLTVTNLAFSPDDRFLLSVGRDRQWALFERSQTSANEYKLVNSNPKAHARMILDCSWAPLEAGRVFASAGRDKAVKLWTKDEHGVESMVTISAASAVISVAFLPRVLSNSELQLAFGLEDGCITVQALAVNGLELKAALHIDQTLSPSRAVTRLAWRPKNKANIGAEGETGDDKESPQLAAASDDTSVRIYSFR